MRIISSGSIDGRPIGLTVERHQMLTQITEIESPIYASQQVGSRHMIIEVERVKRLVLPAIRLTHHDDSLLVYLYQKDIY
jgi:hypothetical protein